MIYATTKEVKRIGDWNVARRPEFRHAIRAYGEPNEIGQPFAQYHCVGRWFRLGLKADFANFGGVDACNPRHGLFARVTIYGGAARRAGWRTWKGVRLGSSRRMLRRRHPSAKPHGRNGWWWIKTGRSYYGAGCDGRDWCPFPLLKAQARSGRVRAFQMTGTAAGD